MEKKVIHPRQDTWYNSRYPWNLSDNIAAYVKDSLRGYILWLDSGHNQYCVQEILNIMTPASEQSLIQVPKKTAGNIV